MEDYQKRVVEEKVELDKKITNLDIFIRSEGFAQVVPNERVRLTEQFDIMNKYSKILEDRINNF